MEARMMTEEMDTAGEKSKAMGKKKPKRHIQGHLQEHRDSKRATGTTKEWQRNTGYTPSLLSCT